MAQPATAPRYPIESVDSAIRLLALVQARGELGLSAAARELGVAPSTAHRLLAMLEHHRLVERDDRTKAYRLGPWLVELALTAFRDSDIRPVARPWLERLVEEVGETAHLAGLQGTDVLFLDCVECSATVRATSRTGQRLPAHCTAAGKAQLAQLPQERLLQLYPEERLEGITPKSTRTRKELLRELARIRAAGYATNRGESEPDVHAVAAAITDRAGLLRGAVTVAGPPARMKPALMREAADSLMETVEAIGHALSDSP
jgi:DNA-binding IclR family transcriptional regulator